MCVGWSLFFFFFFLRLSAALPTIAQNSNYNTVSLRHSALAFAMFSLLRQGFKGRERSYPHGLFWLWIVLDGDVQKGRPRGASHIHSRGS